MEQGKHDTPFRTPVCGRGAPPPLCRKSRWVAQRHFRQVLYCEGGCERASVAMKSHPFVCTQAIFLILVYPSVDILHLEYTMSRSMWCRGQSTLVGGHWDLQPLQRMWYVSAAANLESCVMFLFP
ncbi:unnamed protein product [Ectocarpus sp. 12 AP-2014]